MLVHDQARNRAIEAVKQAQGGFSVTLAPPTRSLAENALLHALLGEIAETQEWAGKKRDIDTWKRLLVAAWLRARGEKMELLPALDGAGVDIVFRQTSKLTKAECAELIDFVQCWQAQNEATTCKQ